MVGWLALAVSTFVSEDLACVAAGLLIARGEVSALAGLTACVAGIVAGDIGLWWLGRVASRVTRMWPRAARWYDAASPRTEAVLAGLRRHAARAIAASRFVPATRVPIYLTAGTLGVSLSTFAAATTLAAAVWVPAVVLLTVAVHQGADTVPHVALQSFLIQAVVVGAALLAVRMLPLRMLPVWADDTGRLRLAARLARWRRWEFWPAWIFYAPVAVWVALLSLWYRGLTTLTAANPGMADGGTVGESKWAILAGLPRAWTIPSLLVPAGDPERRLADLEAGANARGWLLPLVLKPDVGQRGTGVRRIQSWDEARGYLQAIAADIVAQPYHPGPFEAGVFYCRFPHWPRGRILSMTEKVFPEVVGDGVSTLEQLILRHPRVRLQADLFLRRRRDASCVVPAPGERVRLAVAGNHAQGTTFRDGAHLITPALESRFDEIARRVPGFFIGRFDVRYTAVDGFRAGTDVSIVELNGATAESTNIYDPDSSLWSAYRTLFHQWWLVFAVGAANVRRGAQPTSLRRLLHLVVCHLTSRSPLPLSD